MTAANYSIVGKKLRVAESARRGSPDPAGTFFCQAPWDTVSWADPCPKPSHLCISAVAFPIEMLLMEAAVKPCCHSALKMGGVGKRSHSWPWPSFRPHSPALPRVTSQVRLFLHELHWVPSLPLSWGWTLAKCVAFLSEKGCSVRRTCV